MHEECGGSNAKKENAEWIIKYLKRAPSELAGTVKDESDPIGMICFKAKPKALEKFSYHEHVFQSEGYFSNGKKKTFCC